MTLAWVSTSQRRQNLRTDSMLAFVKFESADGRYLQVSTDSLGELAKRLEGLLYSRTQQLDHSQHSGM